MFQQFIDDLIGRNIEPSEKERTADHLIDTCAYAAAAVTLLPLPGTEIVAVMPIHVGMVVGLGHIYDVEITRKSATDLVLKIGATVGVSLFSTKAVTTLAKIMLPGLGGLVGAPLIFANTHAIGMVARVWFAREGEMSNSEMKSVYRDAVRKAKTDFDPAQARKKAREAAAEKEKPKAAPIPEPAADPTEGLDPIARLKRLKVLFEADLIDAEEYARLRADILAEL